MRSVTTILLLLVLAAPLARAGGILRAAGTELRDDEGKGRPVRLRGVNLGGWLEFQEWMCPVDSSKTLRDANPGHNGYDFEVRRLLARRFGAAKADELVKTYQTNWITAADLDNIRALGLNTVRLPFGYSTLLREDGTWRAEAFDRLDWCVAECARRGMFVIIDFHAFLPASAEQDGGATGYWANEDMKAETVRVWSRIAAHFKDNPTVAFYDLLNEPNNSAPHGKPAPTRQQVLDLYDRLYKAVRTIDGRHAIAMEGIWDWKTLRDPKEAGYENVVVSVHLYNWGAKNTEARRQATERDVASIQEMFRQWNVPAHVGEFNLFGDREAWRHTLARYDEGGLQWTMWSYKHKGTDGTSWGLYTAVKGQVPAAPNLVSDSEETIRTRWQAYRTTPANFTLTPVFKGVMPKIEAGKKE